MSAALEGTGARSAALEGTGARSAALEGSGARSTARERTGAKSTRVLKFGGTSVGSAEALRRAVSRAAAAAREVPTVVVVSAFAGVTDAIAQALEQAARRDARYRALLPALRARAAQLLGVVAADPRSSARRRAEARCCEALARLGELLDAVALLRRVPREAHDEALAAGERLAAPVFAAGLAAAGADAELVDAIELVRTDSSFGEGNIDLAASTALAMRRLGGLGIAVVPGFFGADAEGHTVLLGRGGSDTTATVLGAALGAERVEIWTDVDGVLTADPRRVAEARTLPFLSYDDAADAAALGAKVLHSRALAPAAAAGVPIVVRNSAGVAGGETWIGPASTDASAGAFVVTSAPSLASWHALRASHTAPHRMAGIAPGNAVLAAVGPAVWGRAAELVRALDEAGVGVTSLAGGIWHSAFIAIVPERAVDRGILVLHRLLSGELRAQPRRLAAGLPWAALF